MMLPPTLFKIYTMRYRRYGDSSVVVDIGISIDNSVLFTLFYAENQIILEVRMSMT